MSNEIIIGNRASRIWKTKEGRRAVIHRQKDSSLVEYGGLSVSKGWHYPDVLPMNSEGFYIIKPDNDYTASVFSCGDFLASDGTNKWVPLFCMRLESSKNDMRSPSAMESWLAILSSGMTKE